MKCVLKGETWVRKITKVALAAIPAGLLWWGWRRLMRNFTPPNAELAVLEGLELIREPRRVLAVTAHPDDLEAMAGGTLRLMALAGSKIDVVVLADGKQQHNGCPNLGQIRAMEERHAGLILGYAQVHYLDFRDLSLSRTVELEPKLREVWDSVKPDVVFTFDPSFPESYILHPDHLTAGRVVLDILRSQAQQPLVYCYGTRATNVIVEITEVIEDKVQGILAHKSQLQAPPLLYRLGIEAYSRLRGRPIQALYAEGFRAISLAALRSKSVQGDWSPQGRPEPLGIGSEQ